MKEAAAPQSERIAPLEDRPFVVLENVSMTHVIVADAKPAANISRMAVLPTTALSGT